MLERGDHAGRLEPARRRRCRSAPTRCGSSPIVSSTRPQRRSRARRAPAPGPGGCRAARIVRPICAPIALDQVRVEARAPAQRRREHGRLPGREPGQALLVHQRRDAEAARGDDLPLAAGERAAHRAPGRPARCRTAGSAARGRRGSSSLPVRRPARRTRAGAAPRRRRRTRRPDPDAGQLGDLLAQGHPGEQVARHGPRPARRGSRQVSRCGCGGGHAPGGVGGRLAHDEFGRQRDVRALGGSPSIRRISSCIASVAHLAGSAGRSWSAAAAQRRLGMLSKPITDRSPARRARGRRRLDGRDGGDVVRGEDRGRPLGERSSSSRAASAETSGRSRRRGPASRRRRCRRRPAPARKPCSRSCADSRSGRPVEQPIRRWPSAEQVLGGEPAPRRLSESTVGRLDGPVCGSTATTGAPCGVDDRRGDEHGAVDQGAAQPRQVAPLPARRGRAAAARRSRRRARSRCRGSRRPRP